MTMTSARYKPSFVRSFMRPDTTWDIVWPAIAVGAIAGLLALFWAQPSVVVAVAGSGTAIAALGGLRLRAANQTHVVALARREMLLSEASGSCIWERRRSEGASGRDIWWFAPAWTAVFEIEHGFARSPERWFERVHPQDIGGLLHVLERVDEGAETSQRRQYRIRVGDDWRWFELYVTRIKETLIGSIQDATESYNTRERLAHTAFHDPLTGLPNRALFLNRLAHCTARARRNPQYRFALAFLDIDDFKLINDRLGHRAGDQLLTIVGERLAAGARPGDTVARIGGDEFTVLLDPVLRAVDAESAMRRLRESIHGEVDILGQKAQISTSVGIVMATGEQLDALDLLRDADTAMYHAKRIGPGRQQLFDQAMRASVVRRIHVETELRNALAGDGGRLIVHYQPIIGLGNGDIEGFEALVRLRGAGGRLISPSEFIPLSETQGLVDPILDVVLDDACAQIVAWKAHRPNIYVSVNVSARSVHGGLVERVRAALHKHDLPSQHIKLELTESVLVGTTAVVAEALAGLRELGIGLYIDDFGTGFSSLSYLHQFPAERIKLDRSFVNALDGQRTPEIVQTIVSLAGRIGASVIAEGIETETQLRVLRALGCHHGQGFLFAPGLPAETATQFLEQKRSWATVAA